MPDPDEKDKTKVTVKDDNGDETIVSVNVADLDDAIELIYGKNE